jgi:hypothetical protein
MKTFLSVRFSLMVCAILPCFELICPWPSLAQKLQADPTSVAAVSAGFKAHAVAVFDNSTSQKLSKVALQALSNDGITAEVSKATQDVDPKGQLTWPIDLTVPSSAHLPGLVTLRADFLAGKTHQSLFTTIDVKVDGAAKPVEVSIDGSADPISQQRPGTLSLIVTNNLDVAIGIDAQPQGTQGPNKARYDDGLAVGNVKNWTVAPHSVASKPIDLTASFRVTPGVQNVIIDIDAQWTRDGLADSRHFSLTKSVTVGVFFESELLKALSLPSFLALPGCLFLLTFQALISTGWMGLKGHSSSPTFELNSASFWIVALSLSALFLFVYWLVTGINCLLTYGIGDLGAMWISSMILGLIAFIADARWTARWIREHVVSETDQAADVLAKIVRNHLPLLRPVVKFKLGGIDLKGLVLENLSEDQTYVWVSPHIEVEWKQATSQAEKDASLAQQKRFNEIINNDRDPQAVEALFQQKGSLAILKFDAAAAFPGPYHLKTDAIIGPAADQLIVG